MRRLRLAVIGGGHLGRIHARILKNNQAVESIGVVDPDPAAQSWIRQELGLPVFDHHRQLADGIDAVVIATPTSSHYALAIEFLNHGVHTLIEKPITLSVQQADHLIHTADQQQLVLQVGHVERFNAVFEQASQHLSGPRYFEAHRMSGYTLRSIDVGVVHDLMIHDIDLVASLIASPVIETRAIGIAVFGPHEDIAQARLEFANGSVANLTASRCSFQPVRQASWFSEKGYVSIDMSNGKIRTVDASGLSRATPRDVTALDGANLEQIKNALFDDVLPFQETSVTPHNAIEMEQRDFVSAINSNGQPRVTGRHGRRALSIAEAIVDSIKSHRWADGFATRIGHQAERVNLFAANSASNHRRAG